MKVNTKRKSLGKGGNTKQRRGSSPAQSASSPVISTPQPSPTISADKPTGKKRHKTKRIDLISPGISPAENSSKKSNKKKKLADGTSLSSPAAAPPETAKDARQSWSAATCSPANKISDQPKAAKETEAKTLFPPTPAAGATARKSDKVKSAKKAATPRQATSPKKGSRMLGPMLEKKTDSSAAADIDTNDGAPATVPTPRSPSSPLDTTPRAPAGAKDSDTPKAKKKRKKKKRTPATASSSTVAPTATANGVAAVRDNITEKRARLPSPVLKPSNAIVASESVSTDGSMSIKRKRKKLKSTTSETASTQKAAPVPSSMPNISPAASKAIVPVSRALDVLETPTKETPHTSLVPTGAHGEGNSNNQKPNGGTGDDGLNLKPAQKGHSGETCSICNLGHAPLSVCFVCNRGFHPQCLNPPRTRRARKDWVCAGCTKPTPVKELIEIPCPECGELADKKCAMCSMCGNVYHPQCLNPPLVKRPMGSFLTSRTKTWVCFHCVMAPPVVMPPVEDRPIEMAELEWPKGVSPPSKEEQKPIGDSSVGFQTALKNIRSTPGSCDAVAAPLLKALEERPDGQALLGMHLAIAALTQANAELTQIVAIRAREIGELKARLGTDRGRAPSPGRMTPTKKQEKATPAAAGRGRPTPAGNETTMSRDTGGVDVVLAAVSTSAPLLAKRDVPEVVPKAIRNKTNQPHNTAVRDESNNDDGSRDDVSENKQGREDGGEEEGASEVANSRNAGEVVGTSSPSASSLTKAKKVVPEAALRAASTLVQDEAPITAKSAANTAIRKETKNAARKAAPEAAPDATPTIVPKVVQKAAAPEALATEEVKNKNNNHHNAAVRDESDSEISDSTREGDDESENEKGGEDGGQGEGASEAAKSRNAGDVVKTSAPLASSRAKARKVVPEAALRAAPKSVLEKSRKEARKAARKATPKEAPDAAPTNVPKVVRKAVALETLATEKVKNKGDGSNNVAIHDGGDDEGSDSTREGNDDESSDEESENEQGGKDGGRGEGASETAKSRNSTGAVGTSVPSANSRAKTRKVVSGVVALPSAAKLVQEKAPKAAARKAVPKPALEKVEKKGHKPHNVAVRDADYDEDRKGDVAGSSDEESENKQGRKYGRRGEGASEAAKSRNAGGIVGTSAPSASSHSKARKVVSGAASRAASKSVLEGISKAAPKQPEPKSPAREVLPTRREQTKLRNITPDEGYVEDKNSNEKDDEDSSEDESTSEEEGIGGWSRGPAVNERRSWNLEKPNGSQKALAAPVTTGAKDERDDDQSSSSDDDESSSQEEEGRGKTPVSGGSGAERADAGKGVAARTTISSSTSESSSSSDEETADELETLRKVTARPASSATAGTSAPRATPQNDEDSSSSSEDY